MMDYMKMWGLHKLIGGGLILLNAFVWPKWGTEWAGSGWIAWFGVLMVLVGIVKLAWPCGSNCPTCEAPKPKRRKRK